MTICLLCLKECETGYNNQAINVSSDEGLQLNCCAIISKHFWLQPEDGIVCLLCWKMVREFHQFYVQVAEVHNYLEMKLIKSDNVANKLCDNLFHSEVKIEVDDLNLLPQAEIIEGNHELNEYASIKCIKDDKTNETTIENLIMKHPEDCLDDNICSISLSFSNNSDNLSQYSISKKDIENKNQTEKRSIQKSSNISITNLSNKNNDAQNKNRQDIEFFISSKGNSDIYISPEDCSESSNDINADPLVKKKNNRKEHKPLSRSQTEEYNKIIAKFSNEFSCPKCHFIVHNFDDMKRHFSIFHNDDAGYIFCCGRKFYFRRTVAEHALVHFDPEHFKCSFCGKVLLSSITLKVHEAIHTKPINEPKEKKIFQCDKCPKQFRTKIAIKHHLITQHMPEYEYKFKCLDCNKLFPTRISLAAHTKSAHKIHGVVICEICGQQMRNKTSLKRHTEAKHNLDAPRQTPVPMQCQICGTWLKHIAGLKKHMKIVHDNNTEESCELRCNICNKISKNDRSLKRHIYINHACEGKFKCSICGKGFSRPQYLKDHVSVHTRQALYRCEHCTMTFFSKSNMYKHRKRLHPAEWEKSRKKTVPPNITTQVIDSAASNEL